MLLNKYSIGTYTPGVSRVKQILWYYLGDPLVRCRWLSPSFFKVWILRCFGARIGKGVRIKPSVRIKFPWRLSLGDYVWIGEGAWIDNLAQVTLESHVCLSQESYLCTGSHNWSREDFQLITSEIYVEQGGWVAAKAVVGPGVRIGKGAVLGLGSVTSRSLEPMTIYTGNPAEPVKKRIIRVGTLLE